jgi:hypothetical protein
VTGVGEGWWSGQAEAQLVLLRVLTEDVLAGLEGEGRIYHS